MQTGCDHCEADLDGCQDNPCTEGTNCTDITPTEQDKSNKSYTCSKCPVGTKDNEGICLPINECDPANRTDDCEQICVDQPTNYTCTCKDGFRLMENKKNCTDIDECNEGTSGCEQECTNTNGSFVCLCVNGYTLNTDNKTLHHKRDPKSRMRSKELHMWTSVLRKKEVVATLVRTSTVASTCSCNDGSQLMNDKKGCKPCPSGTWGKDCLRDCNCRDSDTNCNVTNGCAECPAGFKGGDCHDDIDECANSPCDEHATCNNTVGTFKCICQAGFTQYNDTTCQDFNECESDPCVDGRECQNGDNKYTCTCKAGYTGTHCETDINECGSSPCTNNGTCEDHPNGYSCACLPGYTGSTCETEMTFPYYGLFRVPTLEYKDAYAHNNTFEYKVLANDVKDKLTGIYGRRDEVGFVDVTDIRFTKGSVVVHFTIMLNTALKDTNTLKAIFKNAQPFTIGDKQVDLGSFTVSGEGPPVVKGILWLPIVLGTVLGLVLLVLVFILVIFIVRKVRAHRQSDSSDNDTTVNYSPTLTKRPMFWQARSPTMPVHPDTNERYEEQRMNVISRAMIHARNIDWSVMRNFAHRNIGKKDDLLHRRAAE
ncbi:hypothetical protein LSAT2_007708 [Lamellibrachia satsuma]|nr:hypothetical protein LSAT2_007708 [Lamellibrachia satsuma]